MSALELYFVSVSAKDGKALVVGYIDSADVRDQQWGDPPMPEADIQRIRDEFGGGDSDD